ncbi:MAG: sigma 54-interacting transcriptional regulator [Acidobacteria bacterium]|nr:sigma 54-interacting transcriptional regulator [Acidobacteriota bacterium]
MISAIANPKPSELEQVQSEDYGITQHQDAPLKLATRESYRLPECSSVQGDHGTVVAASAAMQRVLEQVRQIANLDIPVLLLGETGTGKEVVARLIHSTSCRAHRTFMRVNCAALPSELLESELFGHEVGAFTGATHAKPGKFEICQRGTIFLDEIAEMPIGPQAKFLHVLQDGEFSRLGSPFPKRVDVRILAATNVNIQQAIAARQFREDLYYRVSAYSIYIPPLRARREDIPPLIEHFMRIWAGRLGRFPLPLSPLLLQACLHHPWPGNVRELENFIGRYAICGDEAQALSELHSYGTNVDCHSKRESSETGFPPGDLKSRVRRLKKEAEKEAIVRALEMTRGSRKDAARMLNISVRALQYKMLECEITRSPGIPALET